MAQWYAVLDRNSGAALSFGTQVSNDLPAGSLAIPIDHQPGLDEQWDPATRSLIKTDPQGMLAQKRTRFAQLRAKGWAALDTLEKSEAQALGFELGQYVPPA